MKNGKGLVKSIMSGFVNLNYGNGCVERMPVSGLDTVGFGRGGMMFSEGSLKQMGLDADAMYVMCTMWDGEIKVFEVPGHADMAFV